MEKAEDLLPAVNVACRKPNENNENEGRWGL